MKIIKKVLITAMTGIVCHSYAASEFENGLAPVELITAFNGGGTVYSSLPDDFPVPAALVELPVTMVGTIASADGYLQRILLRSPLTEAELRQRILSAYVVEGWIDISSRGELAVCDDLSGQIYFSFGAETTGSIITITRSTALDRPPTPFDVNCMQRKQIIGAQPNGGMDIYPVPGLRPQLNVPDGATPEHPGFLGGTGGSASSAGIRYTLNVDNAFQLTNYSLSQLFQHLAAQLGAQGWRVDSDDVGTMSGASTWFKTLEYTAADGQEHAVTAHGFLKLLKKETDAYEYRMAVEVVVPFPAPLLPFFAPAL